MNKTKEELEKLKTEYRELNSKLSQLNKEELEFVTGGIRDKYIQREEKDKQILGTNPEEHNIML